MAISISPRALAELLRQLQQEKEERLARETQDESKRLEEEEEERKRALEEVAAKKKEFAQKLKREQEEINNLREAVAEQTANDAEEQRQQTVRRRIDDFRGNDDESLRSRLISEGYSEQLIENMLRQRTLDQKLENTTGLQAAWSHTLPHKDANPIDRIMYGRPTFGDLNNRSLVDQLEHIHRQTAEKGYLSDQNRALVENVAYHSQRLAENPDYQQTERTYFSNAVRTIEDIRREAGMQDVAGAVNLNTYSMGNSKRL
jgi:hypothetical protein